MGPKILSQKRPSLSGFKVLIKELRSLGLNAEILDQNDEEIPLAEDDAAGYLLPDLGGINLAGFED